MSEVGRPKEYTEERAKELAAMLYDYTEKAPLPFWAEFCYLNKVNFRRARDLCKISDEFREAYDHMHAKEEAMLLKGGVAGKLSGPVVTIVLKNHRMSVEYREKGEVGQPKDYSDFFEEIKKRAADRRKKKQEAK